MMGGSSHGSNTNTVTMSKEAIAARRLAALGKTNTTITPSAPPNNNNSSNTVSTASLDRLIVSKLKTFCSFSLF